MKKKILTLAAIAICASVAATGTLAYFTASDEAHNVITSGGVDIAIVETMKDSEGNITEYPETPISGVMPGKSVSKIVCVQNTGEAPAWVRVLVNTGISENGDPITNPLIKNLPLEIEVGGQSVPVITYDINNEDWYDGGDGYYYYKQPVPKVETDDEGNVIAGQTEPLFENVTFAKEMGNEYQNCKVMIDVAAEAIQTDNNPMKGEDYTSVWPEYWSEEIEETN